MRKMVPKESDPIRSCGFLATVCLWDALVGGSVCHCGMGFEISFAEASPSDTVYALLPSDQDVVKAMSASMPPCSPS